MYVHIKRLLLIRKKKCRIVHRVEKCNIIHSSICSPVGGVGSCCFLWRLGQMVHKTVQLFVVLCFVAVWMLGVLFGLLLRQLLLLLLLPMLI